MAHTLRFLTLFFLFAFPIWGEIEQVTVRWRQNICLATCQQQLAERLRRIPGVKDLAIDPYGLQIVMEWEEGAPFFYEPINNAVKWVGLTIDQVFLTVTGKLQEVPERFSGAPQLTLISTGDGTPFVLLSPLQANPMQYTPRFALESHRLTPQLYQQLRELGRNDAELKIEGPLYAPFSHRNPLFLIVESLGKVEEEEKPNENRRVR